MSQWMLWARSVVIHLVGAAGSVRARATGRTGAPAQRFEASAVAFGDVAPGHILVIRNAGLKVGGMARTLTGDMGAAFHTTHAFFKPLRAAKS
jgi:hypothetical protein